MLNAILKLLFFVAFVMATLSITTTYNFYNNLKRASVPCNQKNWGDCINNLHLTAKAKSPFNNYSEEAISLGLKIINSKIDDPVKKEALLWKLKQALISTRSWYKTKNYLDLEARLNKELNFSLEKKLANSPSEPNFLNQFLSQIFFLIWTLSTLIFIWRAFNKEGLLIKKNHFSLYCSILGFIAWLYFLT